MGWFSVRRQSFSWRVLTAWDRRETDEDWPRYLVYIAAWATRGTRAFLTTRHVNRKLANYTRIIYSNVMYYKYRIQVFGKNKNESFRVAEHLITSNLKVFNIALVQMIMVHLIEEWLSYYISVPSKNIQGAAIKLGQHWQIWFCSHAAARWLVRM